jgi:uncharacterized membrane protein YkvA (DUF1232 family)
MIISQVLALLTEANLSPEELGATIGVSGMTIRRWLTKPKRSVVPRVYVPAVREACFTLIAQGRLAADSEAVRALLAQAPSIEYRMALQNLGLREGFNAQHFSSQDDVLLGLSQIGAQTGKQSAVQANQRKIFSFKALGKEWSRRITILWSVVRSKELGRMEKLVAYGALFYLLTPIDFIPDQIPFFGLLDDFGALGIAIAYYAKHLRGVIDFDLSVEHPMRIART